MSRHPNQHITITVAKHENETRAFELPIRRWKSQVKLSGMLKKFVSKRYFIKPSEVQRRKKQIVVKERHLKTQTFKHQENQEMIVFKDQNKYV